MFMRVYVFATSCYFKRPDSREEEENCTGTIAVSETRKQNERMYEYNNIQVYVILCSAVQRVSYK